MAGQTLFPAAVMLLDTVMDALMVTLALRLGNRTLRAPRILLGALCGACMARIIGALPVLGERKILLWPIIALLMMLIADGRAAALRPVRSILLLFASAGLLGGVTLALCCATGALLPAYALAAAACIALTSAVRRERRSAADVHQTTLCIYVKGRRAEFGALCDSGNCLRDYLTHWPVIVLPERTGRKRLGLEDAPLRPIFADTAGGRQMMWALIPDVVIVGRRKLRAAVALSPGMRDTSPALVPASLLAQETESERTDEKS